MNTLQFVSLLTAPTSCLPLEFPTSCALHRVHFFNMFSFSISAVGPSPKKPPTISTMIQYSASDNLEQNRMFSLKAYMYFHRYNNCYKRTNFTNHYVSGGMIMTLARWSSSNITHSFWSTIQLQTRFLTCVGRLVLVHVEKSFQPKGVGLTTRCAVDTFTSQHAAARSQATH